VKDTNKTDPVGQCIFCGVTAELLAHRGQTLTDEHVFPEGLQGDYILTDATCPTCQDVLHRFERHCQRDVFGPIRAYLGAYGRHSERPDRFPVYFQNNDGTEERVLIEKCDYPFGLILPHLPPPGIFDGRGLDEGYGLSGKYHFQVFWAPEAAERTLRLKQQDEQHRDIQLKSTIAIGNLCKLLSKIAHCFALYGYWERYAQLITPFLQDMILSPKNAALRGPYFVGGAYFAENLRITSMWNGEQHLHGVKTQLKKIGETSYLVAHIQLFAPLEMPVYEVVVGRWDGPHELA
jgi:hypothetical protein